MRATKKTNADISITTNTTTDILIEITLQVEENWKVIFIKWCLLLPNGITPIACKQAHGAVVLCKHNPTDIENVLEKNIQGDKIF